MNVSAWWLGPSWVGMKGKTQSGSRWSARSPQKRTVSREGRRTAAMVSAVRGPCGYDLRPMVPPTASAPPPLKLSVVIPCLNAAATIGAQLEALTRQSWEGEWEVIVADN